MKEGPRDPEELTNAFIKANNALFEVQQAMGEDIRAAKTLKIRRADMYESLARLSRKDLGNLIEGYQEVARRLDILHEQSNIRPIKFTKPIAVKIKKK